MNKKLIIPLAIFGVIIILAGILIFSMLEESNGNNGEEESVLLPNMEEIGFLEYHGLTQGGIHTVFNHSIWDIMYPPLLIDGEIHLSAQFLNEFIDRYAFWEPDSDRLSISKIDYYSNYIKRFTPGLLNYTINWTEEQALDSPIVRIANMAYLPLSLVLELYPQHSLEFESEYNILVFSVPGSHRVFYEVVLLGEDEDEDEDEWVQLRSGPTDQYPIIARLEPGQVVHTFMIDAPELIQVRLENGISGWVEFERLGFLRSEAIPEIAQNPRRAQNTPSFDGHINFLWQYVNVYSTARVDLFNAPLGVNVISPYWFLFDTDAMNGDIRSLANHTYMNWARQNGLQVWPMLTDNFRVDVARTVLTNATTRDHVINQMLNFANTYGFEGINLDFESNLVDYADYWIQFVRELSVALNEVGVIFSIATFVPMPWSMFWNRYELGLVADYIVIMAYDEYYGFRGEREGSASGPTSSYPFVLNGIRNTLEEVPAYRTVVGLATYVRIYREETLPGGDIVTTHHQAVGMNAARQFIENRGGTFVWDYINRQYYGEAAAVENGNDVLYRLWLADLRSHGEKFALIRQYDLAGVAFWQKGLALPAMWPLLQDFID